MGSHVRRGGAWRDGRVVHQSRIPSGISLARLRTPRSWSCLTAPSLRPEDLRRLGDAQALQEPHDQALALLGRQLGQRREQDLVGEPSSTASSGPSVASSWRVMSSVVISSRVRPALKWSVVRLRAMVISHAPKSLALPAEGAHVAQRPEEGLRGQVLGQGHRADAVVEEAVDRRLVVVVEQAERLGVAARASSTRAMRRLRSASSSSEEVAEVGVVGPRPVAQTSDFGWSRSSSPAPRCARQRRRDDGHGGRAGRARTSSVAPTRAASRHGVACGRRTRRRCRRQRRVGLGEQGWAPAVAGTGASRARSTARRSASSPRSISV